MLIKREKHYFKQIKHDGYNWTEIRELFEECVVKGDRDNNHKSVLNVPKKAWPGISSKVVK